MLSTDEPFSRFEQQQYQRQPYTDGQTDRKTDTHRLSN